LRLLGRQWRAGDDALSEAAAAAGSDVCFFLHGGTARARGRGEIVSPLEDVPEAAVVLFVPDLTVSNKTATMYAARSRLPYDSGEATRRFVAQPPGRLDCSQLFNGFEDVAFAERPDLSRLASLAAEAVRGPVRLAGAGPALFWLGDEQSADEVMRRAARLPCRLIRTRTARSLWTRS
jgi:4-diphosphocytidyl-2-C-methyl-D-erythritol kinase